MEIILNKVFIILILVQFLSCSTFNQNHNCAPDIFTGIWCSDSIITTDDFKQNAIEYDFLKDCLYHSYFDFDYGVLQDRNGTFFISGDTLNIFDGDSKKPEMWKYLFNGNGQLVIQNLRILDWKIYLSKSDRFHPKLVLLPKQPQNIDEAVNLLKQILSNEKLEEIKSLSKNNLGQLHFGLGLYIRNAFQLWGSNKSLRSSCGNEDIHPDECSTIITEKLWENLQK